MFDWIHQAFLGLSFPDLWGIFISSLGYQTYVHMTGMACNCLPRSVNFFARDGKETPGELESLQLGVTPVGKSKEVLKSIRQWKPSDSQSMCGTLQGCWGVGAKVIRIICMRKGSEVDIWLTWRDPVQWNPLDYETQIIIAQHSVITLHYNLAPTVLVCPQGTTLHRASQGAPCGMN